MAKNNRPAREKLCGSAVPGHLYAQAHDRALPNAIATPQRQHLLFEQNGDSDEDEQSATHTK